MAGSVARVFAADGVLYEFHSLFLSRRRLLHLVAEALCALLPATVRSHAFSGRARFRGEIGFLFVRRGWTESIVALPVGATVRSAAFSGRARFRGEIRFLFAPWTESIVALPVATVVRVAERSVAWVAVQGIFIRHVLQFRTRARQQFTCAERYAADFGIAGGRWGILVGQALPVSTVSLQPLLHTYYILHTT